MRATIPDFTGPPMDPPPLPFQAADLAELRRRMIKSGLQGVRVETITWDAEFRSGAHLRDVVTSSNPIGAAVVADLT